MTGFLRIVTALLLTMSLSTAHAVVVFFGQQAQSLTRSPSLVHMLYEPGQAHSYSLFQSTVGSVFNRADAQISETLFARNCDLDAGLEPFFPPLIGDNAITCEQTQAVATASPFSNVAGISASGTVSAGEDAAESNVTFQGTGTQAVPTELRFLDTLSGDLQRIQFNTSAAVSTLEIDMTYSISASVSYAAGGSLPSQFPGAQAIIEIIDPNSLTAVVSVIAFADGTQTNDELLGDTVTLTVEPNKEYFMLLGSGATLNLIGSANGYDGLDVNIRGYADPTFVAKDPNLNVEIVRTSLTSAPGNNGGGDPKAKKIPVPIWFVLLAGILLSFSATAKLRRSK